jgi:hypothetical protein
MARVLRMPAKMKAHGEAAVGLSVDSALLRRDTALA